MTLKNFSVINHPARMRIFQALNRVELSINQLGDYLPDISKPSLYRHVHKMLEAGVIQVAGVRHINGIEERFYTACEGLIDVEEVYQPGGLEDFAHHVQLYGSAVAQDLAQYTLQQGKPDLDNLIARDYVFYASEQEFLQARRAIYDLLSNLEKTSPAEGRRKRRIFVMGHPLLADLTTEKPESNTN